MGEFQGVSDWYGGKIQQIGRLLKDGSSYKIKLERLESRRSYRFARFYGSRRLLRIRVTEDLLRKERDDIKQFFKHKFILCGRVFVPFHAKEQNVYMVETNENYGRKGHSWCGDHVRLSFSEFINWHNPLDVVKNTKQVCKSDNMSLWNFVLISLPGHQQVQRSFCVGTIEFDPWFGI